MVFSGGTTEKKIPPPGIDPGTVRIVAQRGRINVGYLWNDSDEKKTIQMKRNLSLCHFVHVKSDIVSQVACSLGMSIKSKTRLKSTCDKIKDDEVDGPCSMHSRGCEIRKVL